jgi:inorganic pyrophosphatase
VAGRFPLRRDPNKASVNVVDRYSKQREYSPVTNSSLAELPTFDKRKDLNVIVETPRGNRNKFDFDEEHKLFKLAKVLPEGMVFPFEFGFIPSTLGEDGYPLDILVLMDTLTTTGCLLTARLVGVIEALQTDRESTCRNDRLIAIATHAHVHGEAKKLSDLDPKIVDEIEDFFILTIKYRGANSNPSVATARNVRSNS